MKLVGVIIGGGQHTLQLAHAHIKRKSPIVIVNNSGRVANILAFAYNACENSSRSSFPEGHESIIETH